MVWMPNHRIADCYPVRDCSYAAGTCGGGQGLVRFGKPRTQTGEVAFGRTTRQAVRYPEREAVMPKTMAAIRESLTHVTQRGYFASVAVAYAEEPFDRERGPLPLWLGYECEV